MFHSTRRGFVGITLGLCFALATVLLALSVARAEQAPHVVLIYADDLGYGDVGCYGSTAIETPNIDQLAQEGLRFRNAYAPAATCTPSRYAMLTGEYAWRRPGTNILPGDAAMIIEPGRTTMASILQSAGYRTAVVGKWHLGLGDGSIDWNGKTVPGPLEVGFDESFIMAATGDRVPCVYVRDHHVENLDPDDPIEVSYDKPFPGIKTGKAHSELLRMHPSHGHDMSIVNGISRIGYMRGGEAALWKDETMADVFTKEAVQFIEQNHEQGPLFLFFSLHDPHVPRVPHPRFVGRTDLGPRGDAIVQADWCVGEIVATLERLGIAHDTLVIFTSDNGPVVDDGYHDQAVERLGDHKPWGPLRGGKYSLYEAGTRVPWVVRWPSQVEPGVSDAIVGQVDLPAVFAALTEQTLAEGDAPDSVNVLDALLGKTTQGRDHIVVQGGSGTALRSGDWKYIPPTRGRPRNENVNIELGNSPNPQLFNLSDDQGERKNLADQHPDKVEQLQVTIDAI